MCLAVSRLPAFARTGGDTYLSVDVGDMALLVVFAPERKVADLAVVLLLARVGRFWLRCRVLLRHWVRGRWCLRRASSLVGAAPAPPRRGRTPAATGPWTESAAVHKLQERLPRELGVHTGRWCRSGACGQRHRKVGEATRGVGDRVRRSVRRRKKTPTTRCTRVQADRGRRSGGWSRRHALLIFEVEGSTVEALDAGCEGGQGWVRLSGAFERDGEK